jgi:hypothetical protein
MHLITVMPGVIFSSDALALRSATRPDARPRGAEQPAPDAQDTQPRVDSDPPRDQPDLF